MPPEPAAAVTPPEPAFTAVLPADYPHPEGTDDPVGRFERTIAGLDERAKEQFYRTNFEHMFGG